MPPRKQAKDETVTVAEQKAAGVPEDETVTVAEQRAGEPLPEALTEGTRPAPGPGASERATASEPFPQQPVEQAQAEGNPVLAPELRAGGGTSNESPALPATIQAGAARAHGLTEQLADALAEGDTARAQGLAGLVKDELARYVPDQLVAPGRAEAARVASTEL